MAWLEVLAALELTPELLAAPTVVAVPPRTWAEGLMAGGTEVPALAEVRAPAAVVVAGEGLIGKPDLPTPSGPPSPCSKSFTPTKFLTPPTAWADDRPTARLTSPTPAVRWVGSVDGRPSAAVESRSGAATLICCLPSPATRPVRDSSLTPAAERSPASGHRVR